MSQYVALVAGSIGLGISSIAYYVSYHERYRIQKLRACNKIDIIELQPPSDDKETDTNNEYVVQGIIDSNKFLSPFLIILSTILFKSVGFFTLILLASIIMSLIFSNPFNTNEVMMTNFFSKRIYFIFINMKIMLIISFQLLV